MSIVCQFGSVFDGFGRWSELDDLVQHQTGLDQCVHARGEGSVFFDNAVHVPVRHPFAFDEVVVEWPDPVTVVARFELLCCRCALDRVLDREDDRSARRDRFSDHRQQSVEIVHVVQGERTKDVVRRTGFEVEQVEVGALVLDRRGGRL